MNKTKNEEWLDASMSPEFLKYLMENKLAVMDDRVPCNADGDIYLWYVLGENVEWPRSAPILGEYVEISGTIITREQDNDPKFHEGAYFPYEFKVGMGSPNDKYKELVVQESKKVDSDPTVLKGPPTTAAVLESINNSLNG